MSTASDRNRDNAPLGKKLKDLYDLIEGIEIAMFTTRRPDSQLVSRPMATQTQAEGTDLWFVTDIESNKLGRPGIRTPMSTWPTIRTGPGNGSRSVERPQSARIARRFGSFIRGIGRPGSETRVARRTEARKIPGSR